MTRIEKMDDENTNTGIKKESIEKAAERAAKEMVDNGMYSAGRTSGTY